MACKFSPNDAITDDGGEVVGIEDAPIGIDAFVPDAGGCQIANEVSCVGPTLRTCAQMGQLPVDTPCSWGCSSEPAAHCALLQPSGGAVVPDDLDNAALGDITIPSVGMTVDTDRGTIDNVRGAGTGPLNGIDFHIANRVGIFRFKKLYFQGLGIGTIRIRGSNAVAFVASEGILIEAQLDVSGGCVGKTGGPGGFDGGDVAQDGEGSGSGARGAGVHDDASGGGGGAYGAGGGSGGGGQNRSVTAGGSATGDLLLSALVGGGGGGGGGGTKGGIGGGGGGAIQLVSNGTIRIVGGIDAGGCGGTGTGSGSDAGGGGGAGGAILIEAPRVEVSQGTHITVNGGGGGGADAPNTDGQNALTSTNRAKGGLSNSTKGGDGGDGGAGTSFTGTNGETKKNGGGGGGGVGRIRINTYSLSELSLSNQSVVSPPLGAPGSTASQGTADVR